MDFRAALLAIRRNTTTDVDTARHAFTPPLSRSAAYRAIERGDLPAVRLGRRIVIPCAPLLDLLGLQHDEEASDAAA